MKIRVKKLHPAAIIPSYGRDGAACFDLHAVVEDGAEQVDSLDFITSQVFHTGLAFEIPDGHAMLVFSRSGHGFRNDVRLANCVGVIDADYRGEVPVKLTADDGGKLTVRHGDRIAQAIILPYPSVRFEEAEDLSNTQRGAGGFGSTGA